MTNLYCYVKKFMYCVKTAGTILYRNYFFLSLPWNLYKTAILYRLLEKTFPPIFLVLPDQLFLELDLLPQLTVDSRSSHV